MSKSSELKGRKKQSRGSLRISHPLSLMSHCLCELKKILLDFFRPLFSSPSLPVQLHELFFQTNQLMHKPKLCVKTRLWMLITSSTFIRHQTESLPKNKDNWNKLARRLALPLKANTGKHKFNISEHICNTWQ